MVTRSPEESCSRALLMARIRTMSLRCSPAPRREERKKERPWNVARVIAARRANRSCQKEKKKKKENMEERSPSRFQDRDYVRVRAHRVEWDRVEKNFRGKHSKYIYIYSWYVDSSCTDRYKNIEARLLLIRDKYASWNRQYSN